MAKKTIGRSVINTVADFFSTTKAGQNVAKAAAGMGDMTISAKNIAQAVSVAKETNEPTMGKLARTLIRTPDAMPASPSATGIKAGEFVGDLKKSIAGAEELTLSDLNKVDTTAKFLFIEDGLKKIMDDISVKTFVEFEDGTTRELSELFDSGIRFAYDAFAENDLDNAMKRLEFLGTAVVEAGNRHQRLLSDNLAKIDDFGTEVSMAKLGGNVVGMVNSMKEVFSGMGAKTSAGIMDLAYKTIESAEVMTSGFLKMSAGINKMLGGLDDVQRQSLVGWLKGISDNQTIDFGQDAMTPLKKRLVEAIGLAYSPLKTNHDELGALHLSKKIWSSADSIGRESDNEIFSLRLPVSETLEEFLGESGFKKLRGDFSELGKIAGEGEELTADGIFGMILRRGQPNLHGRADGESIAMAKSAYDYGISADLANNGKLGVEEFSQQYQDLAGMLKTMTETIEDVTRARPKDPMGPIATFVQKTTNVGVSAALGLNPRLWMATVLQGFTENVFDPEASLKTMGKGNFLKAAKAGIEQKWFKKTGKTLPEMALENVREIQASRTKFQTTPEAMTGNDWKNLLLEREMAQKSGTGMIEALVADPGTSRPTGGFAKAIDKATEYMSSTFAILEKATRMNMFHKTYDYSFDKMTSIMKEVGSNKKLSLAGKSDEIYQRISKDLKINRFREIDQALFKKNIDALSYDFLKGGEGVFNNELFATNMASLAGDHARNLVRTTLFMYNNAHTPIVLLKGRAIHQSLSPAFTFMSFGMHAMQKYGSIGRMIQAKDYRSIATAFGFAAAMNGSLSFLRATIADGRDDRTDSFTGGERLFLSYNDYAISKAPITSTFTNFGSMGGRSALGMLSTSVALLTAVPFMFGSIAGKIMPSVEMLEPIKDNYAMRQAINEIRNNALRMPLFRQIDRAVVDFQNLTNLFEEINVDDQIMPMRLTTDIFSDTWENFGKLED